MTALKHGLWLMVAWLGYCRASIPIKAEKRQHDELRGDAGSSLLMSAKLPTKCGEEPFSFWIKNEELEGMSLDTLTICGQ